MGRNANHTGLNANQNAWKIHSGKAAAAGVAKNKQQRLATKQKDLPSPLFISSMSIADMAATDIQHARM